jgi:hypothetical protein
VLKPWPAHLIVADPPYRREHLGLLQQAADSGSTVHLVYGEEERQATARVLRYLVHPRFAMVCVYRAMQGEQQEGQELFALAADIASKEAGVALSHADLVKAAAILTELGVGRDNSGEAKLEARSIPAYAAAEADYEECSRLCLNL